MTKINLIMSIKMFFRIPPNKFDKFIGAGKEQKYRIAAKAKLIKQTPIIPETALSNVQNKIPL